MELAGFRTKTDLKFVKTDFIFFTNGPNGSSYYPH